MWRPREHVEKMVPVQREAGLELPVRFQVRSVIDASTEPTSRTVERICRALDVDPPGGGRRPPCPYPGMRPYTVNQATDFFGRDDDISDVLAHLRRRRIAAVVGPSGSGKSSLVHAGVAHRLRAEGLDDRPAVVEITRPGATPTQALRGALARLADAAGRQGTATPARVLVIDQLEEAFTADAADVTTFFDELATAHRDDTGLSLVLVLRADLTAAMNQGSLWELASASRVDVVPLRGDVLREAIRRPAVGCGVVVQAALVERLVAETEGQPGLLPFLQETLRGLWERMDWRLLSIEAYDRMNAAEPEMSGVVHAIRREGDAALAELAARHTDGTRAVRTILVRLVQFGEHAPDTRRQVELHELAEAVGDPELFTDAYDVLVTHRLLTQGARRASRPLADGESDEIAVVDLSHESIIIGWTRFRDWLSVDRSIEVRRRQWHARVIQYRDGGGSLLPGNDLRQAEAWLAEADQSGARVEDEIRGLHPCEPRGGRPAAAAAAAIARRRSSARDRPRRRIRLARPGIAPRAERAAERETDRRVATELQASAAAYEGDITLQALLVRAADVISPTPLSGLEMLASAELQPSIVRRIDAPGRAVGFEAVSVGDDVIVLGDGVGGLSVWRPHGARTASTDLGHGVLAIAREAGTPLVAVGGGNSTAVGDEFDGSQGWVDLVDVTDPSLPTTRITLPTSGPVSAVTFHGDDLIMGSWDGYVAIARVSNGTTPGPIMRLDVPARELR